MTSDEKKIFEQIEQHFGLIPPQDDGDPDCPNEEMLDLAVRLEPLYAALPVGRLPGDLWDRIEGSLKRPKSVATTGTERFVYRRWQIATAAMSALAASLLLVLIVNDKSRFPIPPPEQPRDIVIAQAPLTALMTGSAGTQSRAAFVLATTANGRFIRSNPATARELPNHTYHLWISNGTNYTYVGVVSPVISHSIPVRHDVQMLLRQGNNLVIDTNRGTEPLPQPVDVVARGKLLPIEEG